MDGQGIIKERWIERMSKKGRKIEEKIFFFLRTYLYFNTVECHKTKFLG